MSLDPLASVNDLIARTTRSWSESDMVRADVLLLDASAAVRGYTGQQLTVGTATTRLKVKDGKVRLPQHPVNDVTAVKDINGNDVSFSWDAGDVVCCASNVVDSWSFEPWRSGIRWVDVTYSFGYDDVPGDIIAVVCQMTARAFGVPPDESGLQSESVAGYSYTVGTAAASGAVGMLPDERAVLDRYRPQAGRIIVTS